VTSSSLLVQKKNIGFLFLLWKMLDSRNSPFLYKGKPLIIEMKSGARRFHFQIWMQEIRSRLWAWIVPENQTRACSTRGLAWQRHT
jgi:hypothetical protein